MIQLPRRSVTRFFIPLIDVLTLLFCIFLLMPVIRPAEESEGEPAAPPGTPLTTRERQELERLRQESRLQRNVEQLRQRRNDLEREVRQLRQETAWYIPQTSFPMQRATQRRVCPHPA